MQITKLAARNFKCFDDAHFEFHPQMNLFIGENGAGKTSLLDAIAVAIGVWQSAVGNPQWWRSIQKQDFRLLPKTIESRTFFDFAGRTEIAASGVINGSTCEWSRDRSPGPGRTTTGGTRDAMKLIRSAIGSLNQQTGVLPVLAYYGAWRSWLASWGMGKPTRPDMQVKTRLDAYSYAMSGQIRCRELNEWFMWERLAASEGQGERAHYSAVKEAVLNCIPEASDVSFDVDRREIVLRIGGENVPFFNLSEGQRMMLAMVADIAIKAVQLNPQFNAQALSLSPGIVLVDELEVHLHPRWQRRVVADLTRTFPKIQFIATSHSPQIVGQTPSDQVWVISPDRQEAKNPPFSFGLDSGWVLDSVMEGQSRDSETTMQLNAVRKALGRQDLVEVRRLLSEVRGEIGEGDPELVRLNTMLRNVEVADHETNQ